jgi:hypothetical protein
LVDDPDTAEVLGEVAELDFVLFAVARATRPTKPSESRTGAKSNWFGSRTADTRVTGSSASMTVSWPIAVAMCLTVRSRAIVVGEGFRPVANRLGGQTDVVRVGHVPLDRRPNRKWKQVLPPKTPICNRAVPSLAERGDSPVAFLSSWLDGVGCQYVAEPKHSHSGWGGAVRRCESE